MNPNSDETSIEEDLPPAVWGVVGSYFGDLLVLLRQIEPFKSIDGGPWSVFVAMANSWRQSGVSPGADHLAAASGWSRRTVFRYVGALLETGVVRSVGAAHNGTYSVGSALDPILRTFASDRETSLWRWQGARFDAVGALASEPSVSVALDPVASASQTLAAAASSVSVALDPVASASQTRPTSASETLDGDLPRSIPDALRAFPVSSPVAPTECQPDTRQASEAATSLNKNNKLRSSSFSSSDADLPRRTERSAPPLPPPPPPPPDPITPRRIACAALAALHRHAYPEFPLPRTFQASDVALVERCGAMGTWDLITLEQMHLDAIQSACRTSSGPPRPAYVWGQFNHFLEHARRGRAERERAKPTPKPPPKIREPEEPMASPEWVAAHVGEFLRKLHGRANAAHSTPPAPAATPPEDL